MEKRNFHFKKACGYCGSTALREYLNFGEMPLVDSYRTGAEDPADKYPLAINYCESCSNSQIDCIVSPSLLFSNYPYHSSVSEALRLHFVSLARYVASVRPNRRDLRCLDIASNDGCLALEFAKFGWQVVGVEPAQNLAAIAEERGVATVNLFWGESAAQAATEMLGGRADVVTATNVFPHVEDAHSFLRNVASVLADDGLLVIEGSYAKEMIERGRFDLIFHEHIYQLLVRPLAALLLTHGMEILDLSIFHLHCGSLRIVAGKQGSNTIEGRSGVLEQFIEAERSAGLYSFEAYLSLQDKAQNRKAEFVSVLRKLRQLDKLVVGYGAASKANVLVNYCGITSEQVNCIIDDTPDKQGRLFPGTDIPVVRYDSALVKRADYIWISAWDFTEEITKKIARLGDFSGKYIVMAEGIEIR